MDSMLMGLLMVVAVVVGFVVLSYLGLMLAGAEEAARSRRAERAERRTWERLPDDLSLLAPVAGPPFDTDRDHTVTDAYRGTEGGRPFTTLRYAFTEDDGSGERREYTVILLELPARAPRVTLVPTEAPVPHFDSPEPEVPIEHPGLAKYFTMHSAAPGFARALAQPELIFTFFLGLRTSDRTLLAVHAGTDTPLRVRSSVGVLTGVVNRVPPEAWDSPGS